MTAVEDAWSRYGDAGEWGLNSVGNPTIELAGRTVTIFRGDCGWGWVIRPRDEEPLAWGLRATLPTAERAKAEAWGALCLLMGLAGGGFQSPPDIVDVYDRLVIDGAGPDDPHLAALREVMTNDELERAKQAIAWELLRREPTPPRAN